MALIFDTGPLVAFLDRDESAHRACSDLILGSDEELLIPSPVLPEVDYLVHTRMEQRVFLHLLDDISAGAFKVVDLEGSDYVRIRYLCERYADSDIGFVDAAVLAITERLNEPKLATLDRRHFGMMRPRHIDALRLLPE